MPLDDLELRQLQPGLPAPITRAEFEARYPAVSVKVIRDGVAVEKTGRVVGRTIAGEPHYDIRLDDKTLLTNLPAGDVTVRQ